MIYHNRRGSAFEEVAQGVHYIITKHPTGSPGDAQTAVIELDDMLETYGLSFCGSSNRGDFLVFKKTGVPD